MKILILLLFIQSCSFKSTAISNLDHILMYTITDKVFLYYKDEKRLSSDLERFLPTLKSDLNKLLNQIEAYEFENNEILVRETFKVYKSISYKFIDFISPYITVQSGQNLKDFFKKIDSENKKSKSEFSKDQYVKYKERFEYVFGEINKKQENTLKSESLNLAMQNLKRIEMKSRNRKLLFDIFKKYSEPTLRSQKIKDLFKNYINKNTTTVRQNNIIKFLNKISTTLTKKQKNKAKEFKDNITEFIKIYLKKW